jgi:hypothetical protein
MFIYDGKNSIPKDTTKVTIDPSVTYVKVYAFQECTSITIITVPSSVTHIGDCAFEGCTSLISVNLPSTLKYIGDHAFQGCKSLLFINIPPSVTFVGDHAFYSCDSLLSNISNYRDIFDLLKNRFVNYPIHDVCSSPDVAMDDIQVMLSKVRKDEEEEILLSTDTWGFTPLHVLCCNSRATPEMIRLVLQNTYLNKATTMTTINDKTPLELYMTCKKDTSYNLSLCLALKMGMKWVDIEKMIHVDGMDTLQKGRIDEDHTGFYPFMLAAIHPLCDMESLCHLALYNIDHLMP